MKHKGGIEPKGICYIGGRQNVGPFVGTLKIKCRIIIRTQEGTIILTTTHMVITEGLCSLIPCQAAASLGFGI